MANSRQQGPKRHEKGTNLLQSALKPAILAFDLGHGCTREHAQLTWHRGQAQTGKGHGRRVGASSRPRRIFDLRQVMARASGSPPLRAEATVVQLSPGAQRTGVGRAYGSPV